MFSRDRAVAAFKREYDSTVIATRITEDIRHKILRHKYDYNSCGGWYENIPRKSVDKLIEWGYFVNRDPDVKDRYVVMFRKANIGVPLEEEVEPEELTEVKEEVVEDADSVHD